MEHKAKDNGVAKGTQSTAAKYFSHAPGNSYLWEATRKFFANCKQNFMTLNLAVYILRLVNHLRIVNDWNLAQYVCATGTLFAILDSKDEWSKNIVLPLPLLTIHQRSMKATVSMKGLYSMQD